METLSREQLRARLKQQEGDEQVMGIKDVGRFVEIRAKKDTNDKITDGKKQGHTTTYSAFVDFSNRKALIIASILAAIPAGQAAILEIVRAWIGA